MMTHPYAQKTVENGYTPEAEREYRCIVDRHAAAAPKLREALTALLALDVKGCSLSDRLEFSTSGRALLEQCVSALAVFEGENAQ